MYKQDNQGEPEIHVSREEARSGSPTKVNRNILGISLPLVIVALALVIASGFWITSQSGADDVNAANSSVASNQATPAER
ncbi:MAG: hypothetical protein V4512_15705 [Pseudomonadota bacterium]